MNIPLKMAKSKKLTNALQLAGNCTTVDRLLDLGEYLELSLYMLLNGANFKGAKATANYPASGIQLHFYHDNKAWSLKDIKPFRLNGESKSRLILTEEQDAIAVKNLRATYDVCI